MKKIWKQVLSYVLAEQDIGDYEVLWQGEYTETHDESEIEEVACTT